MPTVADAIALYLPLADGQKWSSGKRASLARVRRHLGRRNLKTLDRGKLVQWAMTEYPGRPGTAVHMLKTLAGCLSWIDDAMLMDVAHPTAPKDAVRVLARAGAYRPRKRNPGRITEKMIARIMAHWHSAIPPVFLLFLIDTPIRSGELCRIRWADTDLDPLAPAMLIRNRKDPHQKAGNDQLVPLLGRSCEILHATAQRDGRIFPHPRATLYKAFKRASRAAGYELRLHDLRHEGITRLSAAGFTQPEIMAVTGHKSTQTLLRYTHISPADIHRRAADLMPDAPTLNPPQTHTRRLI
jgi:integrase